MTYMFLMMMIYQMFVLLQLKYVTGEVISHSEHVIHSGLDIGVACILSAEAFYGVRKMQNDI